MQYTVRCRFVVNTRYIVTCFGLYIESLHSFCRLKHFSLLLRKIEIFIFVFVDYSYQISTDFKVSMEFRTVKRDGVLLSLSDIYEYPALTLEIYDGQVLILWWLF